jgi:pyruvate dehydrogenase E2 component (dihydrolipoamide acetyltransferase)
MAELKQFRLPDVGEGLTEADIVTWRVKPGDQVTVNQVIVEIETAKSLVELPSPYDGVVTGLLVPEGRTVDVGTPIIEVNVGADAAEVRSPAQADAGQASTAPEDLVPPPPDEAGTEPGIEGALKPKPERQAVLVGYGVKLGTTTRRPRKSRPGGGQPPAGSPGAGTGRSTAPAAGENGHTAAVTVDSPAADRPAAKPPVRKLAKDLGVDLAALAGTGPNGTVTREDVQAAAGQSGPAQSGPAQSGPGQSGPGQISARQAVPAGGEERIPVRGVRKHTAAAVTASAFTAPHVTEFLQIDMTETMRALPRLRDLPDFEGLRVSPLLLVAKALLVAAARHPMINSSWDEDAQEIVVKHYVNLGIAAATGRGLLVPNIKDAHALSLPGLARALGELATTARQGKTQPAELAGGTITITNVGIFGIDTGTPILTPGQAAILAFGQVKDAPWVHEGALAVRSVTTLALSFDHRIVDGDLGSAVLRDVGAMLTDPVRMLAWG